MTWKTQSAGGRSGISCTQSSVSSSITLLKLLQSSAEQVCVLSGLQAGAALANLLRGPPAVHDFISSCVVAAAVHFKDFQVAVQAVVAVSTLKAAQIASKAHREMLWHSVAMMVSSVTVPSFKSGLEVINFANR